MDFVRACDGLSPLPVEEKAIMVTWRALAIPFLRLRWALPPACRGKQYFDVTQILGHVACEEGRRVL